MEKAMPERYAYVHGVKDLEKPSNLKVAIRGSAFRQGAEVPRGFLTVLGPGERAAFSKGSGRLEMADAIVRQPIAARVIVNRIWKKHFGTGLVDTPSNFGVNGERPTHPELLDYLAKFFISHGMSIKALHREIMRSAVYQLGTADNKAAFEKDSGNRLYWRANRVRLTAEQLRDSVLAVSGKLEDKIGGPSVPLTPLAGRRTIYGKVSRYRLDDFLQLFDYPSPMQSAEKRFTTNVPLQRLFLMNSDFMQQQAERVAERVIAEPTEAGRIQKAYRLLFGRLPTAAELKAGQEFLEAEPMRQFEDRKAEEKKAAEAKDMKALQEVKKPEEVKPGAAQPAAASVLDGMMSGVTPGSSARLDEKDRKPVTALGRYIKVLLSSNEFLFIS